MNHSPSLVRWTASKKTRQWIVIVVLLLTGAPGRVGGEPLPEAAPAERAPSTAGMHCNTQWFLGIISAEPAPRIWTNRKGVRIEARFLGVEDGEVRLKMEGTGRTYFVPVDTLSDSDQTYVRQQMTAAARPMQPPTNPPPQTDPRLAQLDELYQRLRPLFAQWRAAQQQIEPLRGPWRAAKANLMSVQARAAKLQQAIEQLEITKRTVMDGRPYEIEIQVRRKELISLQPVIAQAQAVVVNLENQIAEQQGKQLPLAGTVEETTLAWLALCDPFGRLGPQAHRQALPQLSQWIDEEPELWHLYLARGFAYLHAGQPSEAVKDLESAAIRLRQVDPRPTKSAFITAAQAYALSRQGEQRKADDKYGEALKLDGASPAVRAVHSRIYMERGRRRDAEAELTMARQLANKGSAKSDLGSLILDEAEGRSPVTKPE